MIKIDIKKNEITIKGHTEKRVCAAVSILSQTLINTCIRAGIKVIYKVPVEGDTSGETYVSFPAGLDAKGRDYMDFFFTGVESLVKTYPYLIDLNIEQ